MMCILYCLILFLHKYSDVLKNQLMFLWKNSCLVMRLRKGYNHVTWQLWLFFCFFFFCFQKPPLRMKNALGHPGEVPNSKPASLQTPILFFPLYSLSFPSPKLVQFTSEAKLYCSRFSPSPPTPSSQAQTPQHLSLGLLTVLLAPTLAPPSARFPPIQQ